VKLEWPAAERGANVVLSPLREPPCPGAPMKPAATRQFRR